MNLSNPIFEVIQASVDAAAFDSILASADVHESLYEPIKRVKTIRIGDVQHSEPDLSAGGVKQFNAFLTVQCLAKASSKLADKLEARETSTALALEIVRLLLTKDDWTGAICDLSVTGANSDWSKENDILHAVTAIGILINYRQRS